MEPHAAAIVDKLMELVKTENEDNAILCIKIVMDLQRYQSKALLTRVQPFLDLILELFESVDQAVKETFSNPAPAGIPTISVAASNSQFSQSPHPSSPATVSSTDLGTDQQQPRTLIKGLHSFKVIAECPIIVVSIFQTHKDVVSNNVKKFVPLIQRMLLTQAAPQEKAHADAATHGTIFIGVAKDIKNRAAFAEFVMAQVKTMSFLAYLLRMYAQQFSDFLPSLPSIVIRLLRDCPKEKCSTRKELLVAVRHIVNFNFRKIFLKSIDDLLDERTLLGDGLTAYESLRPLAYSMLADLIHHVRDGLNPDQIRKTIHVYTKHLREQTPGTSFQTMSAKLLLNLAEHIAKLEDKQQARYFIIAIIDAIGDKFAVMNRHYSNAVKVSSQIDPSVLDIAPDEYIATKSQPPDWDEIDIFSSAPLKIVNHRDRVSDPVADNKFLFKNLVQSLKNFFYQLRACNPPTTLDPSNTPANWQEVAAGFSAEEVEVLIKLFHEGILIFRYYPEEKSVNDPQNAPYELVVNYHTTCNKEEKDLLEMFATVFQYIDPASFYEVFNSEIPHLYETMFTHPSLSHIPQFLLASEATSQSFAGMLLQFLMSRIDDVGCADVDRAGNLLKLFKLSFMAVTLFSQHNEQVLLPHVSKLITQSLKLSTTAEAPMHYFYLLRALFRAIGGGRFEHLYKEILPLLEMLLEVLNNLIVAARKTHERDLYVELALTVPARLSNLLPHLNHLMKPLVLALRASSDLVGQGLRTLELCVDNLTADYLDPIMAPVIDELMTALWEHLKPSPYNHFHAHTTMRILGKLGGRNRRFLDGPPSLEFKPYSDNNSHLDIKLVGAPTSMSFPATLGIDEAIQRLRSSPKKDSLRANDLVYKQQALQLVITQIKLLIGTDSLPDNFMQLVRLQAEDLAQEVYDKGIESNFPDDRDKSLAKRDEQQETLRRLLSACISATSIPELKLDHTAFLMDVYTHFVIVEVGRALAEISRDMRPFRIDVSEGSLVLDHRVLVDAIIDSLSSDESETRNEGENAILNIYRVATSIFGSKDKVNKLPIFSRLISSCCHSCYEEEWYTKSGGILGISIMASKIDLGTPWLAERQLDICRALLYAAKDLPDDLPEPTRILALDTLRTIVRYCNKGTTREEALDTTGRTHNLLGFIVYELAHTSRYVREAAQECLQILAETTQTEIHELVAPVKARLLTHVFTKPLRTLPFAIQIGYIEAIAYCLRLQHGILEFDEQLTRFLRESIHLADQDDETFAAKPPDQRNHESIIRLRISCLRLLCLALEFPDLSNSPPNRARPRIIAVFFKSLYNKSSEVVDAANDALKVVVDKDPKLPKDVLQAGLRPILVSLQDPSKLRIEGLHCLARLLQLLKSYFRVEIGSRLLDSIKTIADAATLQKASFMFLDHHPKMSTIAAIFNIFHLLPPAANTFMTKLVEILLEVEQQLRRTQFSPFREPMYKYLNRYALEAWEKLFAPGLREPAKGRLFAQALGDKDSGPLRDAVLKDVKIYTESFMFEGTGTDRWVAVINAIHVAEAICKHAESAKALLAHESVRKALLESGKALELQLRHNTLDPGLRLAAEQAGKKLLGVFTTYLAQEPDDFDCLFHIIEGTASNELQSSPLLMQFIYQQIVSSNSVEYWRSIITRSIEVCASRGPPEAFKAFLLKSVVNPILAMDVMRNWDALFGGTKGTQLVQKSLLETVQNKVWKAQSNIDPSDDNVPSGIDHSRMELLQLSTILLKYYKNIVQDFRKDVIRFGWTYIRLDDIINKHGAYTVLAYFIAFFETPGKIASQIYVSLLRAHTPEARTLVMQGLEVLAPVIPKRITGVESSPPLWTKLARRPIVEDSSNIHQMISIFQFVARHPDLFYEAKESFASTIISQIHKIAQLPTPSLDSKKLAIGLVSLLKTWETRFRSESAALPDGQALSPESRKRKADDSTNKIDGAQTIAAKSFISSNSLRNQLLKYLASFIASSSDRYPLASSKTKETTHQNAALTAQQSDQCKRAVTLFGELLAYWDDLDIDSIFSKTLEPVLLSEPKVDEKFIDLSHTRTINSLQLLGCILSIKSNEWVTTRLPRLRKLLEKTIRNTTPEVQECLYGDKDPLKKDNGHSSLMRRIFDAIPLDAASEELPEVESSTAETLAFFSTVATEALFGGSHGVGINLLYIFAQRKPEEIDQHIPAMMKTLTHTVKEHLTPSGTAPSPGAIANGRPGETAAASEQTSPEMLADTILKTINLLAMRMAQLNDHRRPYLSALTTLVEKSPNTTICSRILDLTCEWIAQPNQPVPTLKEKTAVVLKMMTFEGRSEPELFRRLLELVIHVYEDSQISHTELAIRLEPAFLIGTRAPNIKLRERFMKLFDRHLSRTASKRLVYVLTTQSWEILHDSFWLAQVIELLFGSVEKATVASLASDDCTVVQASKLFSSYANDDRLDNLMLDDDYESLMIRHRRFLSHLGDVRMKHILEPLCHLQHTNSDLTQHIFTAIFPVFWSVLDARERQELQLGMISLTTKEYHARQLDKRPNCIQTLLEGIARTDNPRMNFPHHLMKFLAKTYSGWYTAICYMERSAIEPIVNTALVRESNLDALAETYASLQEDDLYYGLWRRRCQYLDTNTALSYEQIGSWDKAQRMFESATFKARTGAVPFSQSEYMLWEDHWVICAQKLQQWEILSDFAKNDNLNDLFLESVYRNFEFWKESEHRKQLDQIIKGVSDAPTPRRAFFQSFMSLLKMHSEQEPASNFSRICDESIQLSIRKWHQLPRRITNAHIPVLQNFQQLVEVHDASVICASLNQTTQANLDQRSPELKILLGTWRDRLPNFWDDINAWQDLVTWRQHIFQLVNQKYLSLVPQPPGNASGHSAAYRGYHETASIINRFAHVARKHQLPDVCIAQLSRIYTLPNIEIQEAFLKLREQAKCHYQNPTELQTGLDVINNTNLGYFGSNQKAEFYTLKGMFLAKRKQSEDANEAFGSALYFDLKLPKAWAEWARYNDQLFKEDPSDISKAANAISCYLEAAGTYKNHKSRKLLSRVLWLLSLDDSEGTLAKTFEDFKGDTPVWYWSSFIPQLLLSLSRQEAPVARTILTKLAKQYPQALYFQLRTNREDMQAIKRMQETKDAAAKSKQVAEQAKPNGTQAPQMKEEAGAATGDVAASSTATAENNAANNTNADTPAVAAATKTEPTDQATSNGTSKSPAEAQPKKPWEYTEEIVSVLKTAFPLLAFWLEAMVDQISRNFKCPPEEDAYRLIVALLNDALGFVGRSPNNFAQDAKLMPSTESNITRFAETILPPYIRKAFENDFVTAKPYMREYIHKLRKWRDRFETRLDRRTQHLNLEAFGPNLSEFKFQKFHEVEIPGQYLLHKDKNQDFIRVERFLPDIELARGPNGICHRRLRIRGHDGSVHPFAIQHPAARTCRREERILQMFRFFNEVLAKRKESRRRRISFLLPVMVPLTAAMRMVQEDPSYITLQGIYENYCRQKQMSRDEPIIYTISRLRELSPVSASVSRFYSEESANIRHQKTQEQAQIIRLQNYEAIQAKLVPNDIVLNYFQSIYPNFADFWLFRRQFAYQLATVTFMTYIMHMRDRNPSRMAISRGTGNVWGSELVPSMVSSKPMFHNPEPVPFRLTPNLQMLMGPIALEGIYSAAVLVIAKSLTEPEFKLEGQLSVFIRDEVIFFNTQNHRGSVQTSQLHEAVQNNGDLIVKRAIALAKAPEGNLPANQTVIDLISKAVNPMKLAQAEPLWMPYL